MLTIWKTSISILAVMVMLGISTQSHASDVITISDSIDFSKGLNVRDAVKNECQLQTKIPAFIKTYGKDMIQVQSGKVDKTKGSVLIMEISNVHAAGGGPWSGAKSVEIKGTLYKGGKAIGDFVASRYSNGGAWGGYKGTCAILGRCAKTLGSDIAKWLKNPKAGAALGDAR